MITDPEVFRSIYEAYPDGVLLVDDKGVIVLANPAVDTLLGYGPGELVGKPVEVLVPDGVVPRHAAYRQGYAVAPRARPMGTELELKAKRADGSEVMVEIALSPLRVGAGPLQAGTGTVVASIRGVGTNPRFQRAMQRARYNEFAVQLGREAVDALDPNELMQRLPAVVAQALDVPAVGVFLLTPNQLELRSASYAGPQAEQAPHIVHANHPDTLVGYVVAQHAPVVVADVKREQRFEMPAGSLLLGAQSALAVPLADRGKVIGVLAAWSQQLHRFAEDEVAFLAGLASMLSTSLQRAQAEAQLRHAQRLESVGQLTGGIAHDFNNLLTVILGNLQMLAERPAVQADAQAPALAAAALRAGQRGAELTSKLLAFSRRQPLAPTALDPAAMLESLADMLRRTLDEQLQVQVHAPVGLPHCLADPVQLEAALLNVAINARDAMQEAQVGQGLLVLRCGAGWMPHDQTQLAATDDPPRRPACVWFSVQDNGCGMSSEVRERAFEPFFTTKEAGRGTGLGLSTVYGFVNQSHGHLRLDSTPGEGTTVTLMLPAQSATGAATAPMGAAELPQGLRVLLVEDDAEVRQVAQAFLQALGCGVSAFASAEAALASMDGGARVDLLLSDITLGAGMDGMELAQRVRQRQPAPAVLLCSGYSRFLVADADGSPRHGPVLRKPYTQTELARALAGSLRDRARSG